VLWTHYIQLTNIEAAFRSLKSDLGLRPIHHRLERRVEAHIFVAFLAYCLQVTLREQSAESGTRTESTSRDGETGDDSDD
jgi:transposase